MRAAQGAKQDFQVGIFILLALMIMLTFSLNLTNAPVFRSGSKFTIYLDDATGIFVNSKVKISGINVGVIHKVELDEGQAKVTLLIDKGVSIPKGAIVTPRPIGILGDKYIEITLPRKQHGKLKHRSSEKWPDLSTNYLERFTLLVFPRAWAQAPVSKSRNSQGFHKSGDVLEANSNSGSIDEVMRKISDASEDIKGLSSDLSEIVGENKQDLKDFIQSLKRISLKIERVLDSVNSGELKKDIRSLGKAAGNLGHTLKNLREITDRVRRGEGSIGQLLNSSETVDNMNRVLHKLDGFLDKANRTRIYVDASGHYLVGRNKTVSFFGLSFWPRESTGYVGNVVVDESGPERIELIEEGPVGGPKTIIERKRSSKTDLKFGFQFVKKVYRWQFRLGIIENKGGLGLDVDVWPRTLRLSIDAYDFTREQNPRVRAYFNWSLWGVFQLRAGVEDAFYLQNHRRAFPYFAGIGLRFEDDDLKSIFSLAGVP